MKSAEQQAALALHRTRDLLVKQVNMVRGLLAEFGIEMAQGLHHALRLAAQLSAGHPTEVSTLAQRVVKKTWPFRLLYWRSSWRLLRRNCSLGTDRTSCPSAWRRSPVSA